MSDEVRYGRSAIEGSTSVGADGRPNSQRSNTGTWTVIAIVAVLLMVAMLYMRYHQNATSTVNPQKIAPSSSE